jgi:hypothetical protein
VFQTVLRISPLILALTLIGACAPVHVPGVHLPIPGGMGGIGGMGGAGHGSMHGGYGTDIPYERGSRPRRDDTAPYIEGRFGRSD